MMTLERAIQIACEAHAGVKDKGGNPYILHPLRVMEKLRSNEQRIVGVLHDVLEDSPEWTRDRLLEEGLTTYQLAALESVTKSNEDADYMDFIKRAAGNRIGKLVKLADLEDNMDLSRLEQVTEVDLRRLEKYRVALEYLTTCE